MQINIHNYEQYLVDYADGVLSYAQASEVKAFLLANPEIQMEFELFASINVETIKDKYEDKVQLKNIPLLKTTLNSDEFNTLCIGHIEKTNTISDNEFLTQLITNDANKKTLLNQYKKTILKNDTIVFDEKLLLKGNPTNHIVTNTNFTEYCIAHNEGWLDAKGVIALNDFVKNNAHKQKEQDLIRRIKFKADNTITFERKGDLKRIQRLSEKFKKHMVYASAIAAMLIFSLMFYNSNQLDNIKQSTASTEKTNNTKAISSVAKNNTATIKQSITQELPLYKDPLRITNIKFEKEETIAKAFVRKELENIQPIQLKKIECPKCIAYNETSAYFKHEAQHNSMNNSSLKSIEGHQQNDDDLAWKIAQAGISGINKVTNGNMALKKDNGKEKTRIAFNSKLFSFSAPVKKK